MHYFRNPLKFVPTNICSPKVAVNKINCMSIYYLSVC